MCLHNQTFYSKNKPYRGDTKGWKVIYVGHDGSWNSPVCQYLYKKNQENIENIKPGFHVFLRKQDAIDWVEYESERVKAVWFHRKDVLAKGFQESTYYRCVRVRAFTFGKRKAKRK